MKLLQPYRDAHDGRGGKWDWHEVGGRWSGLLDGADTAPVATLLEGIETLVSAVVTPDGAWQDWSWDGEEDRPRPQWEAEVRRLLVANADATAVIVDFHL
ncbi:MAG: hypothetical protein ACR2HN_05015 [Tepidiformaceae bacterium]